MATANATHLALSSDKIESARDGGAITPADSDLARPTRAIFVGGAGNIAVTMLSGAEFTITGVLAGTFLPLQITRIKAATTATSIVAFY